MRLVVSKIERKSKIKSNFLFLIYNLLNPLNNEWTSYILVFDKANVKISVAPIS